MAAKRIYLNGNVVTINSIEPQAEAFGIIGNHFVAVGASDEVRKWQDDQTEIIDLGGKTVLPGFIESHNHLSVFSTTLLQADCRAESNKSIDDVKNQIRKQVEKTEPNHWIIGWGYDDTLIVEKRHLTRADLDELSIEHPIYVSHVSGHLAYVNSKTLQIAGIGPDTPQPQGGEIDKDENGNPTGLLMEPGALLMVAKHFPSYKASHYKEVLPVAISHYHQFGITSTHDAAIGFRGELGELIQAYRELENENNLNMRVYLTVVHKYFQNFLDTGIGTGFGTEFVKLGCVKMFQDGSIQGYTAALTEGYHSRPDFRSELLMRQADLEALVGKYHSRGLQIAIHANGDRAIESVIQAFEKAQKAHPREDHRHMIIHCQTASDDHIMRMKALGVVPSFFVNHVYYWGDRHASLFLGPNRARRIDPLGSSMKQGLNFSLHSDLPVTPVDPIFSIHNAVNRVTRNGEVLGPEERIPVMEALKAYTISAAYCSFEENIKGSIAAGKLADFIVLSDNLLTVPGEKIKNIKVLATVVGGRRVYGDL